MKKLIIAAMAMALLSGCTTLKRATGQIDDSTLPGQRQEILPPDQQSAQDPSITGQQPPAGQANNAIQQTPMAPSSPQVASMPRASAPAAGGCDPKVDLCPEPIAPDPVAPISPVKPVTPMATKTATGAKSPASTAKGAATTASKPAAIASKPVVTAPKGTPPAVVKTASKAPASAADAAKANLDPNSVITDPATPAAKTVAKKKIVKKKPAVPATTATSPDITAPAVPDAPQPQGQ